MKIEKKLVKYGDILPTDKLVICDLSNEFEKYIGDENGINIVYSSKEYDKIYDIYRRIYRDNYVRHLNGDIAFTRMVNDTTQIAPFYCIIRRDDNPIEMMMKHFKNINK